MSTTSKHPPVSGHKHTRAERGLALFRERGDEIAETSPGAYRVPGSGGAEYVVVLERGYCSCPDRAANCKHLFAATVAEAKKRCRRAARPTQQPARRHGTPRDDRRDARRGSGPAGSGGIDPARIRANVARMSG